MFIGIMLLLLIYSFSLFYNTYISHIILLIIPLNIYNNIIISLLLLVQIDNLCIYKDYCDIKSVRDINLQNFNIIINQLKTFNARQKFKEKYKKLNRTCSDLNELKNDLDYYINI